MADTELSISAAQLLSELSWRQRRAARLRLPAGALVRLGRDDIDLILVQSGALTLPAGTPLAAGDLVLLAEPMSLSAREPVIAEHLTLTATGPPMLAAALPPILTVPGFAECEPAIATLIRSCDGVPDALDEAVCGQVLTTVMMAVVRAWLRCAGLDRHWPAGAADLNLVLSAIHADPARAWTVASMAALAATSRSVFAERFTRAVGNSPQRYLTDVRMRAAASLLRAGRSVAQTARGVGYTSDDGFARAFRRQYGISPSRWQAQAAASSLVNPPC